MLPKTVDSVNSQINNQIVYLLLFEIGYNSLSVYTFNNHKYNSDMEYGATTNK